MESRTSSAFIHQHCHLPERRSGCVVSLLGLTVHRTLPIGDGSQLVGVRSSLLLSFSSSILPCLSEGPDSLVCIVSSLVFSFERLCGFGRGRQVHSARLTEFKLFRAIERCRALTLRLCRSSSPPHDFSNQATIIRTIHLESWVRVF